MIHTAQRLEGIGEYWFSKKLDEVRRMVSQGVKVINLGIGSPDLPPSIETLRVTKEALDDPKKHGYAPYRSLPELRVAIQKWYERTYGVRVSADSEILPLLGSKEGILYLCLAFVNPGEKILIPDPGYPAYTSVAKLVGAQVLQYDLKHENQWYPDFDELKRLDLKGCKLMWVNYPHMPTGQPADEEVFKKLVAFAKEKNILICHDNPYSLVLNRESPMSLLRFDSSKENVVELNSFSKAFNMAGWRVGMICGAKTVVDAVLQVKSNVDSGMFAPLQMGAIKALENTAQWHDERNEVYRKRREKVFQIFDALDFVYDKNQMGLFVWAKAPEEIKNVSQYLDQVLYEAHVFLTPGFIFGKNGSQFARSSLCASEASLTEARDRILLWRKAK